MTNDDSLKTLRAHLTDMKSEHRALDEAILSMKEHMPHDQLQLVRLKKRKLSLKDEIAKIESRLVPDIIA